MLKILVNYHFFAVRCSDYDKIMLMIFSVFVSLLIFVHSSVCKIEY